MGYGTSIELIDPGETFGTKLKIILLAVPLLKLLFPETILNFKTNEETPRVMSGNSVPSCVVVTITELKPNNSLRELVVRSN